MISLPFFICLFVVVYFFFHYCDANGLKPQVSADEDKKYF